MQTRRTFLQRTGAALAGIAVAFGAMRARSLVPPTIGTFPDGQAGMGLLQIAPDGRLVMWAPRSEMGQLASPALAQIAAEELGLGAGEVELRFPSSADIAPTFMTSGSLSMLLYSEPVARAGAALREALRRRAAEQGGVAAGAVRHEGAGFLLPGGTRLSYADIAGGEAVLLDAADFEGVDTYTFDPQHTLTSVGEARRSPYAKAIATGDFSYAGDVRLEGMVFGRAARKPIWDAKLGSVNEAAARKVPGVIDVVVDRTEDFAGLIASDNWALSRGLAALDAQWSGVPPLDADAIFDAVDVDRALAAGRLAHVLADGEVDATAPWDVDLRFDCQLQSHAQQEPRAAVARFSDGQRLEIWTGSQDPWVIQRQAASDLGWPEENVVVHTMPLGGGFGGREHYDAEGDAVKLAKATGRPVSVTWSREDEFLVARNRPPCSHRVRIRAGRDHRLDTLWHAFATGKQFFTRARFSPEVIAKMPGGDMAAANSAVAPYAGEHVRVEFSDVDLPVRTGVLRSVGAASNCFAYDCAVDELAHVLGEDPVALRLRLMKPGQERLANCLTRVAGLAGELRPGEGRGFAAGVYADKSYAAACVDLSVDRATGSIAIRRVICSLDAGMVVNPDSLAAQVQGHVAWGIGMALMEEVEYGPDGVVQRNFDGYHLPRMRHSPEIVVDLVNDRRHRPSGAGETGMIVIAPAIANAVRAATGVRHTRLPIRVGRG